MLSFAPTGYWVGFCSVANYDAGKELWIMKYNPSIIAIFSMFWKFGEPSYGLGKGISSGEICWGCLGRVENYRVGSCMVLIVLTFLWADLGCLSYLL